MTFIPLKQLEGFLYTINSRKSMKPGVQNRLLEFQKGLTELIHNSFNNEITTNEVYKSLIGVINDLKNEMIALKQENQSLKSTVDYLIEKDALNDHYVDKRLASVGGKLLSSVSHKKRKSPQVA